MKNLTITPKRAAARKGLSILEFLACVIAVLGGMWFGAVYLGLDVEGIAYNAVRDTPVLESLPEEWRPEPPEGHVDRLDPVERSNLVQQELVELRKEIIALRETTVSQGAQRKSNPNGPSAESTITYWKQLRNIAFDEAALQSGTQSMQTEANADRVFALRARVSRFAANAVDTIPSQVVDGQARSLGQELKAWYLRGANLYDQAAQLLSNRNAQASSAQLAKRWETAERQLQNEAAILSNKAESVRAALSRTYSSEFPAFGS